MRNPTVPGDDPIENYMDRLFNIVFICDEMDNDTFALGFMSAATKFVCRGVEPSIWWM